MPDILCYGFTWRAILASVLAGATCGIVGVWVILLNIPFVGVAMSHSAFAGAVFGLLFNVHPMLSALSFASLTSFLIGPVADRGDMSVNISIGIIFSFVLGVAFLGVGLLKGPKTEALNFLWGNILTVSYGQILLLAATTAFIVLLLVLLYRQILAVLFSREIARASGVPERFILYLLLFVCGVTVTLNLNTVGGILIFSLITSSPLAAYQLTCDLRAMYLLSALFGVVSCLSGLLFSYLFDVPSGAVIIIVSSAVFGICMILSPKRRNRRHEQPQAVLR